MNNDPGARLYTAEIEYPTGINRTYGVGRKNFYKNKDAKNWLIKAVFDLRNQGLVPHIDPPYWVGIWYLLTTVRMDVDAPSKAIVDAVAWALSANAEDVGKPRVRPTFDDTWVFHIEGEKRRVKHYNDQRSLQLIIRIIKANDVEHVNVVGKQYSIWSTHGLV